jgi:CheY-like chemotaxis protein
VPTLDRPAHSVSPERIIFAVDDDAGDRLLFAQLLEAPGPDYACRAFSSGGELMNALLKVLRGAPIPLACFIDIKMTGMSGFDVLRWVRCQDPLNSVPVIMLSSSDDPENLHEACGVGAQCFVRKFPSALELREILTEAQRYSADRSTPAAFHLPCNLLHGFAGTPSRLAVAY